MMRTGRVLFRLATIATIAASAAGAAACATLSQSSAGGTYIDPADAANSVVLHVENQSPASMELRTIQNGQSLFIGSVGPEDTTSILLNPLLFPTATLYIAALPADGRGRAVVGPLAATKGATIKFNIQPAYEQSRAIVVR
jgi:hypothetical protein